MKKYSELVITDLKAAAKALSNDALVAIPTETVYGLAANAFSENAIDKIYQTKNRPQTNPLIVHLHNFEQLPKVAKTIPKEVELLAAHFWPGPLTVVLEKSDAISTKVTAGKNTVAVRVPNHELTLALLRSLAFPLVAPSANKSNHISPTCPQHVFNSLKEYSPLILDGGICSKGIESTIIGFENHKPTIYRLGSISKEAIEAVLGTSIQLANHEVSSIAPGMQKKHYAPRTPFISCTNLQEELKKYPNKKIGVLFFTENPLAKQMLHYRILSSSGCVEEAMANLYKMMHELDELELDVILSELAPEKGVGASINDRLTRASS
jgi:L-threonylcarbamoyladenylate synthase